MRLHGLRTVAALVASLLLFGCPREPAPLVGAAVAPSPASAASASDFISPTATPPPPSPAPTPPFVLAYTEGNDTLSFAPPGNVRLTSAGHDCDTELSPHGNLWTGRDVDAAIHDAAVQNAIAENALYRSHYGPSRLTTSAGTITWVTAWREWLPPEPPSVHHVQEVLRAITMNRKKVCGG